MPQALPFADTDRLARMLAGNAGVDWDRLNDYPGYSRYRWREQAQAMQALMAGAGRPEYGLR